jgi:hypothetical protein
VLTQDEPFRSLGRERRARIIHEQTLVATFAPEAAVETLATLRPDPAGGERAAAVVQYVPRRIDEMAPGTPATLQRFREVLGLPRVSAEVTEDPLAGDARVGAAGK